LTSKIYSRFKENYLNREMIKFVKEPVREFMAVEKDNELIKEFLGGSESAFNKIAAEYRQKIYWHARRMLGNHIDADEVTQEVLIVIYNKLKDFKFNSTLFTWIYRITTTRSLNYIKKRQAKKFLFFLDDDQKEIETNEDIIKNVEDKEKMEKLQSILNLLPVKQREVFVLRNFDELSYEEISEITGKSVGGLKANYFHALQKIKDLLNEQQ